MMGGMAAGLSEEDMADLDAFYSSQTPAMGSITPEQEELALAGQPLYRAGSSEYQVPACMGCHGPAGEGNPLAGYPALAGQHATYTSSMLTRFENGERWGEDDAASLVMTQVSDSLSADEIEALASYIQGLYGKSE